jgi:O-antigen/teichoic acid export membrane protein
MTEPTTAPGHVVRGSAWMGVSVAVGAVTGAAFWLVAARLYRADQVGNASALFTSVMFVNYATTLGLPVATAAFAADDSDRSSVLFTWALVLTTVTSLAGGALYLAAVDPAAAHVLRWWGDPVGTAIFALVVAGTSLAILNDVRLVAARRWGWVLARYAAVGLLRFPLLWTPLGGSGALWVFLLGAGAPAASGWLGCLVVNRLAPGRFALGPLPDVARRAARYATVNYASMLAAYAPTFAVPVLVLVNVPAAENARFFVAWSVAAVAALLPQTIGQVLLVEGGKATDGVAGHVRTALGLAVGVMAAALAVTAVLGRWAMGLYGAGYADAAGLLLPLVAAGVPWALTSVLLSEARLHHDHARTVAITAVLALAILVPALVLVPRSGAEGAAAAWFWGQLGAAAFAVAVRRRSPRAAPRPVAVVAAEPVGAA